MIEISKNKKFTRLQKLKAELNWRETKLKYEGDNVKISMLKNLRFLVSNIFIVFLQKLPYFQIFSLIFFNWALSIYIFILIEKGKIKTKRFMQHKVIIIEIFFNIILIDQFIFKFYFEDSAFTGILEGVGNISLIVLITVEVLSLVDEIIRGYNLAVKIHKKIKMDIENIKENDEGIGKKETKNTNKIEIIEDDFSIGKDKIKSKYDIEKGTNKERKVKKRSKEGKKSMIGHRESRLSEFRKNNRARFVKVNSVKKRESKASIGKKSPKNKIKKRSQLKKNLRL